MDAEPDRASRAPATPAGKRALTRAENRRQILEAARRVFAEKGYGATTVRHIIRATPLASGTFYNYFKSKEEVFQAIRDEMAVVMRPALREARRTAASREDFVRCAFDSFFASIAGEQEASDKRRNRPHVRVDTPEIVAGFKELSEDIVWAMERGLLPAADPEFLTAAMAGVAFEIAEAMQKQPRPDPAAATRFATALFLGGIDALPKAG
jgi:AcrR family transcriptional regulator